MATGGGVDAAARSRRRPWAGRRIILGVGGGIAAYKSVQLARDLTELGAIVDVVLTHSARSFVGPITFEALTGRPVAGDILAPGHALDHVRLGREADVVCIAPATADFLARAANGQAGDTLTAVLLATRAPVILCPAMNDAMFTHPATAANLRRLADYGYEIVGPAVGPLAFGEGEGPGRMEAIDVIVQHVGRALEGRTPYTGRRVVVTAGPTREAVDPVRFLSNRSSGRMGFALAAAAWRRGADVLLVAGPTQLAPPHGPRIERVETAAEMESAVVSAVATTDALFMSAAVADFRPAGAAGRKIKKSERPTSIPLEPAPDVLASSIAHRRRGMVAVGFALETDDARENAREKLRAKALDMIVLNEATSPDAGFEVPTNRVVLIDREGGEDTLPLMLKEEVAEVILDRAASWLPTE
ncbi:MAG TPA: bifunctional phosphopantothenoylcysteine decarboxylase/phosphopantothenate--cysteine ligase CoaBC [Longimicrobiales bacterium]|nr:bifunctional phosphopantothenoylcysteine decarboxylase/phosphopantothenate--cysteine ligase CoaBC [Longimicrobiales bacterium]